MEAAIFDMDGLLADTEPLWHEVECAAYAEVGLHVTAQECMQTMGMRVDEAVGYWFARSPWAGVTPAVLSVRIVDRMVDAISTRTEPMPGAIDLIARVRARGWSVALASSSPYAIIDAVVTRCGFLDAFEVIHSAQDEDYGKPHPAIYLTAAAKLGVAPTACVALEDSVNGMVAAKAARMGCIAVPMPEARSDPRWALADVVVESLADVDDACLDALS
nr:hexitol phosphatase HxpB [Actinomycetota bacterium]